MQKEPSSLHSHDAWFRFNSRWRQLVALARVTTSEYGNTAAGHSEARELLGLA